MKGYDRYIAAGLVVVLVIATLLAFSSGQRSDWITPERTSYNSSPSGTRALYLGLQALGCRVGRWKQKYTALSTGDALVVVMSSPEAPFSTKEWQALADWVRPGRQAIVAWEALEEAPELTELVSQPGQAPPRGLQIAAPPPDLALPSWPAALTEAAPRLGVRGKRRLDLTTVPLGGAARERPSTSGEEGTSLAELSAEPSFPGAVALYDSQGPVVALARIGKGSVLLISTPWMLSNAGIGCESNFALVASFLRVDQPGRVVWFDEYHQGYGEQAGALSLLPRPVRFALLHLMVGVLVLLVFTGWRLGRASAAPLVPRTRTEYLATMGALLLSAGATDLAARRLLEHYRGWIARALKVPVTDNATLIILARQRHPALGAEVERVLGQGERLAAAHRPGLAPLLDWAQRTARLCLGLEGLPHEHR
jgi:hypothetical protein